MQRSKISKEHVTHFAVRKFELQFRKAVSDWEIKTATVFQEWKY